MPFLSGFYSPAVLAFASVIGGVLAYEWPSPQYDALEELLYQGTDQTGVPVASLAITCNTTFFTRGPSIAAEWLRLAYHDMATFNVTDGTGGLDASILYELHRAENIGDGNINSLSDFRTSISKHVSLADIIAMGATWGVAGCDGPLIPYRGGRIDARKAGLPGVPEPQQDLETHKEKFRLQGFTPEEMIQMVACGHTIGAVRAIDFPDIVKTNNPINDSGAPFVESFDSTNIYDTAIVTEYLSGTTKNPLVVNPNVTIQSDLRIFASDGNVTMKSMESPSVFLDTCGKLFERMLNTVPKGVQLTEEIKLLPFKVKRAQITVINKQLMLKVKARVTVPLTPGSRNRRTVKLFWCDRRGENAECANNIVNFASPVPESPFFERSNSPIADRMNTGFETYTFRAPISSSQSAGRFWFTIVEDGGTHMLQDNGGKRYFIEQDALLAVPQLYNITNDFQNGVFSQTTEIVVALNTSSTPSLAQVHIFDNTIQHNINVTNTFSPPRNSTQNLIPATHIPPVAGYTFYTANYDDDGLTAQPEYTVEVNGERYTLDPGEAPSLVLFGLDENRGSDAGVSAVGRMSLTDALQGLASPSTIATSPESTGTGTSGASGRWKLGVFKYVAMAVLLPTGSYIL